MSDYVNTLAKEILAHAASPVPKVRFAKIIYFAFKQMVLSGVAKEYDLAFIRMPLGPVADGFMDLSSDPQIVIIKDDVGLSYNREKYSLKEQVINEYIQSNASEIKHVLSRLQNVATSDLIASSHKDSSWISNRNGAKYYITSEDVRNPFPSARSRINEKIDDQLVQSQLINGMLDDAVNDSSALEHPDYYQNG